MTWEDALPAISLITSRLVSVRDRSAISSARSRRATVSFSISSCSAERHSWKNVFTAATTPAISFSSAPCDAAVLSLFTARTLRMSCLVLSCSLREESRMAVRFGSLKRSEKERTSSPSLVSMFFRACATCTRAPFTSSSFSGSTVGEAVAAMNLPKAKSMLSRSIILYTATKFGPRAAASAVALLPLPLPAESGGGTREGLPPVADDSDPVRLDLPAGPSESLGGGTAGSAGRGAATGGLEGPPEPLFFSGFPTGPGGRTLLPP
mmetsp:Transcript_25144/g.70475  ORF Transcript_25144/g.70475 Transcript_25144/m.70475 type:complete len:265 (-) Transcript_25144:97-891(-)